MRCDRVYAGVEPKAGAGASKLFSAEALMSRFITAALLCVGLLTATGCMSRSPSDVNGAQAAGATNDDAAGGADN